MYSYKQSVMGLFLLSWRVSDPTSLLSFVLRTLTHQLENLIFCTQTLLHLDFVLSLIYPYPTRSTIQKLLDLDWQK